MAKAVSEVSWLKPFQEQERVKKEGERERDEEVSWLKPFQRFQARSAFQGVVGFVCENNEH